MMTLTEALSLGWRERAQAFADWRNEMDRLVTKRLGMGCDDLPDWDFASAFESGQTARKAAEDFIEQQAADAGFDPDEFSEDLY